MYNTHTHTIYIIIIHTHSLSLTHTHTSLYGQVHVAIGVQGVDCSDKEVVAAAVLQSLLGGGDQFSAGGPGKGLTSRIFRNVLSNPEVLTATSFNVSYQDTGLFGIQATCNAQDAPKTVALLTRELAGNNVSKSPLYVW